MLLFFSFGRIRVGTVNMVSLNNEESIMAALKNKVLLNRLRNVFLEQTGYPGGCYYKMFTPNNVTCSHSAQSAHI